MAPSCAPVVRLASWDGWCLPCGTDDRPLVLTWSGARGLRAWLSGRGWDDGVLRLTCVCCGGVDVVPWDAAQDGGPDALPDGLSDRLSDRLSDPVQVGLPDTAPDPLPDPLPVAVPDAQQDTLAVALPRVPEPVLPAGPVVGAPVQEVLALTGQERLDALTALTSLTTGEERVVLPAPRAALPVESALGAHAALG